MPTYPFNCAKCKKPFEVYESINDYSGSAKCPKCKKISRERIFCPNVVFIGAAVQNAEYNPAFGKVVKNKRERDELAKRHGLIEIGNEKPETIHKLSDETKAYNRKKSWDKV